MANKTVFGSTRNVAVRNADTTNQAGGLAYSLSFKEALAQMVMTGVFNGTFYTSAKNQIDTVVDLLSKLGSENAEFVAKLAMYARDQGYMKDTPAFLTAWLTSNGKPYLKETFSHVIDNGKMLRNFVQIMRSGAVGRKSLGTGPKKLVQKWLNEASMSKMVSASVGNDPSLADVIKMVHPTPASLERDAFFRWAIGQKVERVDLLPKSVQDLIKFRNGDSTKVPSVPFELLTSLELSTNDWKDIAKNAGWQMTRMNLNTFKRKGVLEDPAIVNIIATRLADPEAIASARVMPYQIFTTWLNVVPQDMPYDINLALEKALEVSLKNVPKYNGKTWVFVDVSGSMSSAITGERTGSSSKMRCVDVASLIASSLLRANPENTNVTMFDTKVHSARLNPFGSVMENAKTISRFGGGGTACQLPLQALVNSKAKADLVIYISDNESWFGGEARFSYHGGIKTQVATAWEDLKKANPKVKMVCIDLSPNTTTQNPNSKDVLNVGGFNDAVYKVIQSFLESGNDVSFWTNQIENSITFKA